MAAIRLPSPSPIEGRLLAFALADQRGLLGLGLGHHQHPPGLAFALQAGLLGRRLGLHDRCFRHLAGLGQFGVAGVLGNADLHLRLGQLGLQLGLGHGLVERLLADGRLLLLLVGFHLLDGELPLPQLFQQALDLRVAGLALRPADQHVDALDVEMLEPGPQFLPRLLLDLVAAMDQLQHALLVGHVAEIGARACGSSVCVISCLTSPNR